MLTLLRRSFSTRRSLDGVLHVVQAAAGEFRVSLAPDSLDSLECDVAFADLPELEAQLAQGRPFGMLESRKGAVVQLAAPLSGSVLRRNEALLASNPLPAARIRQLWLLDVTGDAAEFEALQDK